MVESLLKELITLWCVIRPMKHRVRKYRPLDYERVYLSLPKVADKPFPILYTDIIKCFFYNFMLGSVLKNIYLIDLYNVHYNVHHCALYFLVHEADGVP